jgi:hypothetical protein
MNLLRPVAFGAALLLSGVAHAQQAFPTPGQSGGVPGVVQMFVDPQGKAVPATTSGGGAPSAIVPNRAATSLDGSGAIATGGTFQKVFDANPNRLRLFTQNYCSATTQGIATAESLFIVTAPTQPTSTAGAIELTSCGTYETSPVAISTDILWIMAATTGHKFVSKEQ